MRVACRARLSLHPGLSAPAEAGLRYPWHMDPGDLLERLRTDARDAFARSRILVAYAHGSRVAGRDRPDSDLDVGYYLCGYRAGETLTLREEMCLASRLSDVAGVEVDLRNLAPAPLEVRGRVLVEGQRLYCSDEVARVTLERELLGRYLDYQESFRAMHRLRLERVARLGLRR